jgi:hypothetical protein
LLAQILRDDAEHFTIEISKAEALGDGSSDIRTTAACCLEMATIFLRGTSDITTPGLKLAECTLAAM